MVPSEGADRLNRSPADTLGELERLSAELENVLARLRSEARQMCWSERAGEHRESRLEPEPIQATDEPRLQPDEDFLATHLGDGPSRGNG
jgi:hypothetical protein